MKKSLTFPARFICILILLLLFNPCLAQTQFLLDTFTDDTLNGFPNGPEIGAAKYGGTGGVTHTVVNIDPIPSYNHRLLSQDPFTPASEIAIQYTPTYSAKIFKVGYLFHVYGNTNPSGQDAFSQTLTFNPSGANISLQWGVKPINQRNIYIEITRPFSIPPTTVIDTGIAWSLDTFHSVLWSVDTINDRFSIYLDHKPLVENQPMSYNFTNLDKLYFQSNAATNGGQYIDDVTIERLKGGSIIWHVDEDAVGANNGFTWGDAFNDLQDAFAVALAGDQIWVAEGKYYPDRGAEQTPDDRNASFELIDGVAVYGGFAGGESSLIERDWHANETILSGDIGVGGNITDNSYHVVYSDHNNSAAVIDGFTITRGNANGAVPDNFGGGMHLWASSPTIGNITFEKNTGERGGGFASTQLGSPFMFNCNFDSNAATYAGGGIEIQHGGLTLNSCMFVANASIEGGAIHTLNNELPSVYTNCVLNANLAYGNGGAISHATSIGTHIPLEIVNCSINLNHADQDGGGIFNYGANASINSCILWDNTDQSGSGETAQVFPGSIPPIRYSCIMGWSGAWSGGANIGNIGDDPLFVDPDGLDDILGTLDDNLRLQLISPCIDTGDPDPAMNDSDGTRNDMGAYGGPGADLGGIGVIPGSGFLFTDVGNIPRSEITMVDTDPDRLLGTANVFGTGLGIPTYVNTAFARSLWLHGLFGADNMDDIDYYQVLVGQWDGATPPDPLDPDDWQTLDDKLVKVRWFYTTEWEHEYVKVGPHDIDGVEDLYLLTPTTTDEMWSRLTVRIVWNTRNYPNGTYTVTVKTYDENPPGTLTETTALLGDVTAGNLILRIDNTPVTNIIHSVNYDPANPYYIPAVDGEIQECSIINLGDKDENLRFFITASHPHGFLRQFTLDNISGKNLNGGVIAQQVYPGTPPALWNGVTNTEFESQFAPNPPGNLQSWRRCAYQFRLHVWPRITNGFDYLDHSTFSDHYFIDLPGALDCSVYDINNDGMINLVDFAAFAAFYLQSCVIE